MARYYCFCCALYFAECTCRCDCLGYCDVCERNSVSCECGD